MLIVDGAPARKLWETYEADLLQDLREKGMALAETKAFLKTNCTSRHITNSCISLWTCPSNRLFAYTSIFPVNRFDVCF